MLCSHLGPGNLGPLNLFLQFCAFFQYNLHKNLKMNVSESDIPRSSLNGRLPAYETYWPQLDVTHLFLQGIMHSMYTAILKCFSFLVVVLRFRVCYFSISCLLHFYFSIFQPNFTILLNL